MVEAPVVGTWKCANLISFNLVALPHDGLTMTAAAIISRL